MPIIGFGGGFGGGGGTSYINGVVPTSADLPTTVGNPPTDSVYLAKVGSGVWLINRKPAGLYVRVADNGVAADWTYLGAFPEVNADGNWELYNTADPTKELKFSLSGLSTGTTRTLTVPNASGTIALNETFAAPPAIGSTTRNTGAFTTLSAAPTSGSALTLTGGTVTASAPLIDASQTWNNGAVAFTGIAATITNTASATGSLVARFTVGSTNVFEVDGRGFTKFRAVSNTIAYTTIFEVIRSATSLIRFRDDGDIQCNSLGIGTAGNSTVQSSGIGVQSTASIGFGSDAFGGTRDAEWRRDAADTIAQRRGTSAQTFRIYNTFTDVTNNFERGFIRWNSNLFQIGTEKGATTGTRRALEFVTDNIARWRVGDGSITAQPSMLALGNSAIFGANDSYNVIIASGASGTWRTGVFGPNGSDTGYLAIGESLHLGLTNSGSSGDVRLVRDAANVLALRNGASTPQAYRIYNTFASTTSFERANFRWASNEFIIDAEAGSGGGTLRGIRIGSATTSLLGFYNATAIAQPSSVGTAATGFTSNGPTNTVHADSTFTGGVGTTAYNISDIVKHLKNLGLIAS